MALLEVVRQQPTAVDGAHRIKVTLHNAVHQMEQSLAMVRAIIEQHGKPEIAQALGSDAAELQLVYNKIKSAITDLDSSRQVPDLP